MNHGLGATAGATEGNVRAILALSAMLFLHVLFAVLLLGYMRGSADSLKDFLLSLGSAVVTLDVGAVSYYVGKRAGEAS